MEAAAAAATKSREEREPDFYVPINVTWRQLRHQAPEEQPPVAGPQTRLESLAWGFVRSSRAPPELAEPEWRALAVSSECERDSLAELVGQLEAAAGGARCQLVACGPLPLRQHLHPAALRNKVALPALFESYVDLSKEFARRFGHISVAPAASSCGCLGCEQPAPRQQQQQQQVSSISLRVDQMLSYLALEPEREDADAQQQQVAECCRLNGRVVRSMRSLVRRMLADGERQSKLERIRRQVEVGLCEQEPAEGEQRVVRARGLPWQASEQDIADFFVGLNIARGGVGLCLSRQGRRNGEALVQFESREHRNLALGRHRHFMGQRYIEVYRATGDDFLGVATGYNNKAQAFLSRGARVIVRMRGLPFACTGHQVVEFFAQTHYYHQRNGAAASASAQPAKEQPLRGCEVSGGEDGVLFVKNHDDKPTGDAFVLFASEESAQRALQKHHQNIGARYVELFRSSVSEVQQVLSISMDPPTPAPPASGPKSTGQRAPRKSQPSVARASAKQSAGLAGVTYAQVATGGAKSTQADEEAGEASTTSESAPVDGSFATASSVGGDDVNYPTLATTKSEQSSARSTDSSAFDNNSLNLSTSASSSSSASTKSGVDDHRPEQHVPAALASNSSSSQLTPQDATSHTEQLLSANSSSAQSPISTLSAGSTSSSSYKSSQFDAGRRANGASTKLCHQRAAANAAAGQQASTLALQQPQHYQHNQHRAGGGGGSGSGGVHGSHYNNGNKGFNHHNNHQPKSWQAAPVTGGPQHPIAAAAANFDPNAHYLSAADLTRHYGHHQLSALHMSQQAAAMAAYHQANYHHQAGHYAAAVPPSAPGSRGGQLATFPPQHFPYYPPPPPPIAYAAGASSSSTPPGSANGTTPGDQQCYATPVPHDPSKRDCVRLRGLPFEAQVEDVLYFLGERSSSILYQGVHMVYSAQGQPTGEAVIQMSDSAAASAAAQEYHKKVMTVGKKQRYIEVVPCSIDELGPVLGFGAFMSPLSRDAYMGHPMHPVYALPPHQYHQVVARASQASLTTPAQPVEGRAPKGGNSVDDSASEQESGSQKSSDQSPGQKLSTPSATNSSEVEKTKVPEMSDLESQSDPTVASNVESPPESEPHQDDANNLMVVQAAAAAAAYYPILYYYPHHQMVAPPYH